MDNSIVLWLCMVGAALMPALPAIAHGEDIEIVVEVASQAGLSDYGIEIRFADRDPVTGARVVLRGEQGNLVELAEAAEDSPGVYVGGFRLSSGSWRVGVAIDHPEAEGSIQFDQSVGPGKSMQWLVLVDTAQPDRVGTVPEPSTALLDPPKSQAPTSTTETTSTEATVVAESDPPARTTPTTSAIEHSAHQPATAVGDVVVDVSDVANPSQAIGMRVIHMGGIGLWLIPLFADFLIRRNRKYVMLALVGLGLTVVTGVSLMLWEAPVAFPGLLNWGGLTDVPYGISYLVAS